MALGTPSRVARRRPTSAPARLYHRAQLHESSWQAGRLHLSHRRRPQVVGTRLPTYAYDEARLQTKLRLGILGPMTGNSRLLLGILGPMTGNSRTSSCMSAYGPKRPKTPKRASICSFPPIWPSTEFFMEHTATQHGTRAQLHRTAQVQAGRLRHTWDRTQTWETIRQCGNPYDECLVLN